MTCLGLVPDGNPRAVLLSDLPTTLQSALKERYEILRELGRGGMAIVYAARDIKMNREVAIKVLLPDLSMAMGPERFAREIEIAGHLSHPHILAVFDSGNADGNLYYVMPFVRGESLRARMEREKLLPVDEALRLSIEVAEALDYAHKQGVVHRDIKPENILLEGGHAIVADFGIARAVSTMNEGGLTATGMSLGTAAYMSPEQAAAEKNIDGRSDIYSLACVTYEMLAGQPPFTGPNSMAIMARHALEMPPSLTIVRDAIPDEVEETVFQALAKSAVDRFETAADFAEALQDCLLVAPTTSRKTVQLRMTATTKARRHQRQVRKTLTMSGIALGAILLAFTAWKLLPRGGGSRPAAAAAGGLDPRTIAVLYFEDRSSDSSLGHVADALTEGLIDELSVVSGLHVVSRNGSAAYRATTLPMDSVARALQAGSVIAGDIEVRGKNLHVTALLYDGNGVRLGNLTTTDLPADQLLALRGSLVSKTAELLRKEVGTEVQLRESRAGTEVVEAWSNLQRAERVRKDAAKYRASGANDSAAAAFRTADSLLALAATLDGKWAEPIVLRGYVAYESSALEAEKQKKEPLIKNAIALASRALEVQPNLPSALALRGRATRQLYQLNIAPDAAARDRLLDAAEADLKAATMADGSQAAAFIALSQLYYDRDDNVGALLAAQRAFDADAFLSSQDRNVLQLFWTNYDLQRFGDARDWCLKGAQRFPADHNFVQCQLWLMIAPPAGPRDIGLAWKLAGQVEKLAPADARAIQSHLARIIIAGALARAEKLDSARHVLAAARAGPDVDPEQELRGYEAIMRVLLNEKDEAVKLLKAYVQLHPTHEFTFGADYHWWWLPLRDHPGFLDVARRKN